MRLQLDQATREEIGRQAKRVLDWGRLRYLEEVTDLEVRVEVKRTTLWSVQNKGSFKN